MEIQDNVSKAREIANEYSYWDDRDESGAAKVAFEMAEWKDQQFKEYLEKKIQAIKSMEDIDTILPTDTAVVRTLTEIINKLFGGK